MRITLFNRSGSNVFRSYAIHYLRTLESGLIVLEGNEVFVNRAIKDRSISCFTYYGCNRLVPSGKGIGVLRGGILSRICRSGRHSAIVQCFALQLRTVFVLKGNEVLVNRTAKGCRIGSVFCNSSNWYIPTFEGVGVLRITLFNRSGSNVFRSYAIHYLRTLESGLIVLEGNEVFVNRAIKDRSIGCLTYYGCNRFIPALEGIGVLRCCSFGRICRSGRHGAILNFRALQLRTIFVLEGDGVFINRVIVCSRISYILSSCCNRFIPSRKGIGILRIGSLGGSRRNTWYPSL